MKRTLAFGPRTLDVGPWTSRAMPIVKKRNQQTETRLLLESGDPVELPPADVDERSLLVQFDQFRPFLPELLEELRDGTIAEPVAVMNDGSTFAIHGDTKTFWVKLWHAAGTDLTKIDRVQVLSCIPSTRGIQISLPDEPDE
jgi:hypothetical protein